MPELSRREIEPARNQPPAPVRLLQLEAITRRPTPRAPGRVALRTPAAFVDFTAGGRVVGYTAPPPAPAAAPGLDVRWMLAMLGGLAAGGVGLAQQAPLLIGLGIVLLVLGGLRIRGDRTPPGEVRTHALPHDHRDAIWSLLAADQRGTPWDVQVVSRLLPGVVANPQLYAPRAYRAAVALALEAEFHPQREQFLAAAEEVTRIPAHEFELLEAAGQQMEQAHLALLDSFRLAHEQRRWALGSAGLPAFDDLQAALTAEITAGEAVLENLNQGYPDRETRPRRRLSGSQSPDEPPALEA